MYTDIFEEDITINYVETKNDLKLSKLDDKSLKFAIANKYIIINNKEDLRSFALESFTSSKENKVLCLGLIPDKTIERIRKELKDIKKENIERIIRPNEKYILTLSQYEIKHIKKDSLTINEVLDFITKIDLIITEFDEVRYYCYNNTQASLRFKKKIDDVEYITLEIISNKYKTFKIHTAFMNKKDFLKIYSKKSK